ncbi:MAG: tRNA pseudouridine(55) synthase TruB [Deferrisomatales bacterium]|nr:tRNA pseudouridine(55) synthase TruB [Deferrisomatales bacterium]
MGEEWVSAQRRDSVAQQLVARALKVFGEPWGLLVLDKPEGITSHTAVQRVRRALGASRAGHAGTLDPLATGILLVGLGRATRLLEYLVGHEKEYRARVRLGERRDTLDREGRLLETRPVPDLGRARVEDALRAWRGTRVQVPPAYSAVKIAGVPLHRRARRGEEVAPPPRTVEIRELELLDLSVPDLVLRIVCSSGTYVRSLARDLGDALGTGAILWELTRTRSGPFGLEGAPSLGQVEEAGPLAWSWVLPPGRMVEALPRRNLSADEVRDVCRGRAVPGRAPEPGPVGLFDPEDNLVAVAREEAGCLQPLKVFGGSG